MTIIFDLSDVLIKGLEGSEDELARILGLSKEAVAEKLFSFDYQDFWVNRATEQEIMERLIQYAGWDVSVEELLKVIYANFREIAGTRKLMTRLGAKYPLILLSVNSPEWASHFEKNYSYTHLFKAVHYSYQIGYTKREPESFQFILDKYKLDPNDVLLIDDSTRNLNVAKALGIDGIKFRSADQVEQELKHRAVL